MYALTVWAPWSTLIIEGWKPYEFRGWDYRTRRRALVGQRIAIHAGARPVKRNEVLDLLDRLERKHSRVSEAAAPFLEKLHLSPGMVPLAAVLGTAVLGEPIECRQLFGSGALTYPDSDRIEHQAWAWPLSQIERFPVPVPARGAQGFWRWSGNVSRDG
jgi:hypothetical protein